MQEILSVFDEGVQLDYSHESEFDSETINSTGMACSLLKFTRENGTSRLTTRFVQKTKVSQIVIFLVFGSLKLFLQDKLTMNH